MSLKYMSENDMPIFFWELVSLLILWKLCLFTGVVGVSQVKVKRVYLDEIAFYLDQHKMKQTTKDLSLPMG